MRSRVVYSAPSTPRSRESLPDRPKTADAENREVDIATLRNVVAACPLPNDGESSSDVCSSSGCRETTQTQNIDLPPASGHDTEVDSLTVFPLEVSRRQIAEQEVLIRAYQAENEEAVRKIKLLENEVQHLTDQLEREQLRCARQLVQARDEARVRDQEADRKTQTVMDIEKKHQDYRRAVAIREGELRERIDTLRRQKTDLEAKLAGVDLPDIQREESALEEMRKDMEAMKRRHEEEIETYREKVRWYTENQELLDTHSRRTKEQASTILQLRQKLKTAQKNANGRLARRNVQLEEEIESLKEAVAARHPDSVAALVQVSKQSTEEQMCREKLEETVLELKEELKQRDRAYELELRTLRQRHEKLKQTWSDLKHREKAMKKGDAIWLLKLKHAKQIKALKNQLRQKDDTCRKTNVTRDVTSSKSSALSLLQQQIAKNRKLEALVVEQTDKIAALKAPTECTSLKEVHEEKRDTVNVASTSCQTDIDVVCANEQGMDFSFRTAYEDAIRKWTVAEEERRNAVAEVADLKAQQTKEIEDTSNAVEREQSHHWKQITTTLQQELERKQEIIRRLEATLRTERRRPTQIPEAEDFRRLENRIVSLQNRFAVCEEKHAQEIRDREMSHAIQLEKTQQHILFQIKAQQLELSRYRLRVEEVLEMAFTVKSLLS